MRKWKTLFGSEKDYRDQRKVKYYNGKFPVFLLTSIRILEHIN